MVFITPPPTIFRKSPLAGPLEIALYELELDRKGLEEKRKNPPRKSGYRINEMLFRVSEPPTPQP